jgi:hypothetical protein
VAAIAANPGEMPPPGRGRSTRYRRFADDRRVSGLFNLLIPHPASAAGRPLVLVFLAHEGLSRVAFSQVAASGASISIFFR